MVNNNLYTKYKFSPIEPEKKVLLINTIIFFKIFHLRNLYDHYKSVSLGTHSVLPGNIFCIFCIFLRKQSGESFYVLFSALL